MGYFSTAHDIINHTKMADWDDDNFEPTGFDDKSSTDKWEGEDEEDDSVKDNWDDDDDNEEKTKEVDEVTTTAKTTKKKRTLKEAIKEKEAKKVEEQKLKEEMRKKMEEEESEPLTQEEIMAEKLRQQKLVEDSDLLLAMDTFGSSKEEEITGKKSLDSMNPSTQEEFTEYSKLLVDKLSKFESNVVYVQFLEDTLRDLCASMEADDIKKLSHCLNLLHTEKIKAQKGKTKGKNKKKVALTGGKAGKKDDMDYNDYGNEFDDFM